MSQETRSPDDKSGSFIGSMYQLGCGVVLLLAVFMLVIMLKDGPNGQQQSPLDTEAPMMTTQAPLPTLSPTLPASPTKETAAPEPTKHIYQIYSEYDGYGDFAVGDPVADEEETFYTWSSETFSYVQFPLRSLGLAPDTQIPYAHLHLRQHPNSTAGGRSFWVLMPGSPCMEVSGNDVQELAENYDECTKALWHYLKTGDASELDLLTGQTFSPYQVNGEDVIDVTPLVQKAIQEGRSRVGFFIGSWDLGEEHSQEWFSRESDFPPILEIDP